MEPYRLLFIGVGYANKGQEAMALATQRELTRRLEHVEMYALCSLYETQLGWERGFAPVLPGMDLLRPAWGKGIGRRIWVLMKALRRFDPIGVAKSFVSIGEAYRQTVIYEAEKVLKHFDGVVDISGYTYRNVASLRRAVGWVDFARKHSAAHIFMPQTWGPFAERGCDRLVSRIAEGATLCYARDEVSQRELIRLANSHKERILLSPDVVFGYQDNRPETGKTILRMMGVEEDVNRPIIGIAASTRLYDRTPGQGTNNAFVRLTADLIDRICAKYNARIILIPNEAPVPGDCSSNDDRYVCALVRILVKDPSSCYSLKGYQTAETIYSLVGQLEALVSSRFHTLVFALAQGIPCIAMSWLHKYGELLRLFEVNDFVLELKEQNADVAWNMLEKLLSEAKVIRERILKNLGGVQKNVNGTFDKAAEAIQSVRHERMQGKSR